MIKYRPHRGGLAEAMQESKEFGNINDMIEYICSLDDLFRILPDDVTIGEPCGNDDRVGWRNVRYVFAKRIRNTVYEPPVIIGCCTFD